MGCWNSFKKWKGRTLIGGTNNYVSGMMRLIYMSFPANCFSTFLLNQLDSLHYKTENVLIQLIKSLQQKMKEGSWNDNFIKER